MLKTIQVIALLQGLFLILVLFIKRKSYKRVNFLLLLACIVSLLLYAVGDDDFNLFVENANWYAFHSPLIITIFFLYFKYHNSDVDKFQKIDFLIFIPYLIFLLLQLLDTYYQLERSSLFMVSGGAIGLIFFGYLAYIIYKSKKENWMLLFLVPFTIFNLIDFGSYFVTGSVDLIPFLDSYGAIVILIFLLYAILFKLILSPKSVLPISDLSKYKTSSLNPSNIEKYKKEFILLMTEKKIFTNSNLTVNDAAKIMGIPRQHLSEVLNVYMKISFQDLLNQYRVEEFVNKLEQKKYRNYTLLGIANEVGFSSKTTFNTAFKKIKGITPSQFKKQLKM